MKKSFTKRHLADALGVTRQTIYTLGRQGMPCDSIEAAQSWRDANVRPRIKAEPTRQTYGATEAKADPEQPPEYLKSRARREAAEASISEMREAELAGELVRVDVVKAVLGTALATAREALLQIPARLAPMLAADSSQTSVQNMMEAEIHRALTNLAGASGRIGADKATA